MSFLSQVGLKRQLFSALKKIIAETDNVKDNPHFRKLAAWINQEPEELNKYDILQIQDIVTPELINELKKLKTQPPSLTLYRGLYWPSLKDALTVPNAVLKNPPKIGDIVTYKDKGASSWSVSRNVACGFSQGAEFGIVIQVTFMPNDIICYIPKLATELKDLVNSSRKDGLEQEKEVIVQGGIRKAKIVDIYKE